MTIHFYRKDVYGRENLYIVGKEAQPIAELTGKKTIDERDIENFEKLGILFTEVLPPRKEKN